MINSDAPSYTFNGRLAQVIGLDAAVLYDVLARVAVLETPVADDGAAHTLCRQESAWLALVPFLSPGRFMAALERLVDAGLVAETHSHADGRDITLPGRSDNSPTEGRAPSSHGPDAIAAADTPTDRDTDGFDIPPPAPTTRMLTDDQDKVRTAGHRPRYSDQPLYLRGRENTGKQGEPGKKEVSSDATPASGSNGSSTMALDWQPSADCLRMIEGKGIETEFALAQRESFVLYYRDSGQRNISWDTKFLNWVSRRWQYHLNDRQHDTRLTENSPGPAPDRRQKLRSRLRNIGDFDW